MTTIETLRDKRIALFSKAIAIAENMRTIGQEGLLTLSVNTQLDTEKRTYLMGFLVGKLGNPVNTISYDIGVKTILDTSMGEPIKGSVFFFIQNGFWSYGINVSVPTRYWVFTVESCGLYGNIIFYDHNNKINGDYFEYIKNNSH